MCGHHWSACMSSGCHCDDERGRDVEEVRVNVRLHKRVLALIMLQSEVSWLKLTGDTTIPYRRCLQSKVEPPLFFEQLSEIDVFFQVLRNFYDEPVIQSFIQSINQTFNQIVIRICIRISQTFMIYDFCLQIQKLVLEVWNCLEWFQILKVHIHLPSFFLCVNRCQSWRVPFKIEFNIFLRIFPPNLSILSVNKSIQFVFTFSQYWIFSNFYFLFFRLFA